MVLNGLISELMNGSDSLSDFMMMMLEVMIHCPVGTLITPSLDAIVTLESVGIMDVVAMCTLTIALIKLCIRAKYAVYMCVWILNKHNCYIVLCIMI